MATGGLTWSEMLAAIVSLMGGGGLAAVLLAVIGARRAAREPPAVQDAASGRPGSISPPVACGVPAEQIDRLRDDVAETGRAITALASRMSQYHVENSDRLGRIADKIDHAIDANIETRRAIQSLQDR